MDEQLLEHEVREMNERWADSFDDPEGMQKVAAVNRDYIEDHIRLECTLDALKEPEKITAEDCDRSVDAKSPIYIDEVRDGQWALAIDFTGSTRNDAVRQPKYAITINRLQTATAVYDTDEIRMARRPITQHLREDLGDALINAKDRVFVTNVETAVWFLFKDFDANNLTHGLNNTELNAGTATEVSVFKSAGAKAVVNAGTGLPDDTWALQAPRKTDFTDFQNAFNDRTGQQLIGASLIITNLDFNKTSDWTIEEVGFETVQNTVESVKGYRKFKDFRIVRTGKHRWYRPGNMYGFGPWTHLGRYFQMDNIHTFQDKRGTRVEKFAWGYWGLGFGNMASLKKMEFYSASSTPTYEDTISGVTVSVVRPLHEEHVIRNNRVDTGVWFPKFTSA